MSATSATSATSAGSAGSTEAAGPALPPPPSSGPGGRRSLDAAGERTWAGLAHLSALGALFGVPVLGPLVFWLLKKDESAFVADQALEALNFNLSALIYVIVGGVAGGLFAVVTLGLGAVLVVPAAIAASIAWLALTVVATVEASNGRAYRYPLTLRLVR